MPISTSPYTSKTQIAGALKQVYAKKFKDLRTEEDVIQTLVGFEKRDLVSDVWNQPVAVTQAHGYFNDSSNGVRAQSRAPKAMKSVNFQVPTNEITEIFKIPFGTIASLNAGTAASFFSSQALKMMSAKKAANRTVEWTALYGNSPVCQAASVAAPAGGQVVVTLDPSSVPEGFVLGLEGCDIDVYNGVTKLNTNAYCVVEAIDLDASPPTMTLSGNGTDLSAIQGAGALASIYRGDTYGQEQVGLIPQALNTGTLYGVDYSQYSLLRAVKKVNFGQLSFKALTDAFTGNQAAGIKGEVKTLVSAKGFNSLVQDMAALRRIGGGEYKHTKMENGAQGVEFFTGTGSLEIISHTFLKNGDVLAFKPENLNRIGSTDITDSLGGEDLSVMASGVNAMEFRLFTSQATVNTAPRQTLLLQGCTFA